jgi:hypothetical protein
MKTCSASALSRRSFLTTSATAATALTLAPAAVLGRAGEKSPSQKPTLAGVGVGGVGFGQLAELEQEGFQIAALCDVDDVYAKKAYDK